MKNNIVKKILGGAVAVAMTASVLLPTVAVAAPRVYNSISNFRTPQIRESVTTVNITTADQLIDELGDGGKGDGTEATNPKKDTRNKKYVLASSIDMNTKSSGKEFVPIETFYGEFDGQSNTISNLRINTTTISGNPAAAFFQTLGVDASIHDATFVLPHITGSNRAATICYSSKGIINNIEVKNAKIELSGATITGAGGLVGEYVKGAINTTGPNNIQNATGKITNCLFTGSITDQQGNELPSNKQTNVGGIMGRNASNNVEKTDIDKLFWDMSTTKGINKVVGGGAHMSGAVGVNISPEKKIIEGSEINFSEIITYNPTTAVVDPNWAIGTSSPADCVKLTGSGYGIKGENVGTAQLTHTIQVGTKSFTVQSTIKVVAGKEALKVLMDEAIVIYPASTAGKYNNQIEVGGVMKTQYQVYTDALAAAKAVYDNDLSTTQQVRDAQTVLEDAIKILIQADRDRLSQTLLDYEAYTTQSNYYEAATFALFQTAYSNGKTVKDDPTRKTLDMRDAISSIENSFNALKLLLGEIKAERSADNTEVIITVNGYKKPTQIMESASTSATVSTTTAISGTNIAISNGIMTIKIPKGSVGNAVFNKGGTFNVQVTDTQGTVTVLSAPKSVALPARANFVLADLENVNLGNIALNSTLTDKAVEGIKLLYNPQTGAEDGYTVKGAVTGWEFDDDPQYDDPSLEGGGQTWATVGVKHLVGIIADGTGYTNPDGYKVKATVEVIDKTELNARIIEANGYKEADYTKDSWTPFKLARDAADVVNKNKDAKQQQINKALADLMDGINGLLPQPVLVLKARNKNLRKGDVFVPELEIDKATDVSNPDIRETLVVTNGEEVIYKDGAVVTPLDTSKATTYELVYTITNAKGISASADLTVTVLSTPASSSSTGTSSSSSSSSTGGGGGSSTVDPGKNTVSNGDVSLEFNGSDIFTKEELDKGAKLVLEVGKVTDDTNIKAVLEKVAKLLKGEVTIDGIFDIKIFKDIEGTRTKISNSDIKGVISIYLPISKVAIDSKDNAVIHVLENSGYEIYKGAVEEKDGKNVIKISIKQFSEFAVVYGGQISNVADNLDPTDPTTTPTTNGNGGGTPTTLRPNGGGAGGTNAPGQDGQGGGDGGTGTTAAAGTGAGGKSAATGDSSKLWIFIGAGGVAALLAIIFGIKMKHNKK